MAGHVVGQVISLPDRRRAIIRFIGATHFAPGEWIGIELEEPTGKNDGAVQGERYFDCEQNYGMFIRPTAVTAVLEQPRKEDAKPPPKHLSQDIRGRAPSTTPGSKTGTRRQSVLSTTAVKRQGSNTSSPSPVSKLAAQGRSLRSPTKSPTKQLSEKSALLSRTTPSISKPPLSTPKNRPGLPNRASMPPPATTTPAAKAPRQSPLATPNRLSKPGLQPRSSAISPAKRMSLRQTAAKSASPQSTGSPSSETNEGSVRIDSSFLDSSHDASQSPGASRLSLSPAAHRRSLSNSSSVAKELEDLKAKLRVMEKKRAEDREKMQLLETIQAEKEKYEGIIQKLQAKYQPQQQEIAHLRRQLKEAESRVEEIERLQAEHESILEMAALDREMAEEVAEAIKAEYEALKMRTEELELEVEVLREENQELGQVTSPEERSSQGWLQMERTNERLREALIRLRDMTQQQEADLKSQIKELEEDLEGYAALKARYESTKEQLTVTEANMEELKQQVEALGAEEMIEELSEKNMQYQEQISELKAAIEDLENLKELSDELEITHVETEKQLQDELDYRDSIYHEQNRKIAHQDEVIEDLEYTLSKFRELVTNLQSDLEDMRVSQQISETEANDLSARSRAMIDLNLKLQASAAKAQVKTIDLELGRMEAEESAQHLAIMKEYLPEYFDTEKNPILALLRFKRVGFKSSLMGNTVRERVAELSSPVALEPDSLTAYDLLEKLTWISLLCERFVKFVHGCSSEEFAKFEGALYELDPVERILNASIENLKRSELNERKCAEELQRSIALLSHLAETLIPPSTAASADEVYMQCVLTQTYMENTASSLSHLKLVLQTRLPEKEDDEEGSFLLQKIDALAGQARGSKVISGKITRSFDELRSSSLSLSEFSAEVFERTEQAAKEISEVARQLGENLLPLITEEGRAEPITYAEIVGSMAQTVASVCQPSAPQFDTSDALSFLANKIRMLGGYLDEASSVSSDLSQTIEFERLPAPWISRAKELKSNQTVSPDTEEELRRLRSELNEASTALGLKDKVFEEQTIKIELLESRMREAGKKAALVKEMESKLEASHSKEVELLDIMDRQSGDIQNIAKERDDYRNKWEKLKRASGSDGSSVGPDGTIPVNAAASLSVIRENDALRAEVASLQAAVRFLRDDNRRAHLLDPYSVQRANHIQSWLDTPLVCPKVTPHSGSSERLATSESQDVLSYLVKLTKESKLVDIKSSLPADSSNRLAWRPIKSTVRYHAIKQREQYEQWSQWKDEIVHQERARGRKERKKSIFCLEKHRVNQSSVVDSGNSFLSSRNTGAMDPAWEMLGMQKDEVPQHVPVYGSSEGVAIVDS
ncbi:CAP-Gly domain containing protein [Coccidioides posadasii C735 delta SOWgp]|uniref:Dynactin n=2 Tax=Coccidioides posadasii TaxID=199306 RepID=E9DFM5_COCPS|nr:CAP-Gly domain containing protein [Coccidioides posadasii C735 delta SOWgp]EER29183.1 CAP-Gly domain containing protein [Coccidioides posadasii C735 delta SOWgp]EFW14882.1 dynactin [Coccidioides posadasii str. Silveira]|eukprot:XP_003071328.1 CAP-Gly domain containing protein [Coccidioides posadasii C735 delta SOWgp]